MLRFRMFFGTAAILAGIASLCMPPPARADFSVKLQEGLTSETFTYVLGVTVQNGAVTVGSIGPNGKEINVIGAVLGDFSVTGTISDSNNSPGSIGYGTIARITLEGINVLNTNAAAKTLVISASDAGFTFPYSASDTMHTTASSTVTTASGASSVTFIGKADTTNTLFGDTFDTSPGIVMNYPQNPASQSKSGSLDKTGFNPLGMPYSLTGQFTYNLAGMANVSDSSAAVEITGVPEPSAWALACAGVGFLFSGHRLRRRWYRLS